MQVIATTAFPLTFSGAGTTQHVLDEFAIYDGVLSAADVHDRYTAGAGVCAARCPPRSVCDRVRATIASARDPPT